MGEFVTVTTDEHGVATLRLDRPPMNALNRQIWGELGEAAAECTTNDDIRAVVLWGGPKIFAAGADIKQMKQMSFTEFFASGTELQDALKALQRIPKVVIAAVNGYALGGGLELALACDLRVAADDSVLGLPEITLGMIPGSGGTQRLAHLVGLSRAKDAILRGRRISADEALQWGLVAEVVPLADLDRRTTEIALELASKPPLALKVAKRVLNLAYDAPLHVGLELEGLAYGLLRSTDDFAEGVAAFTERRPPNYTGR